MGRKLDGQKNIVAAGELTVVQYIETGGGGGGGASDAQYIMREEWTTQGVRSFSQPMTFFSVENKGTAELSFSIGGLTLAVKPTETFSAAFDPFSQVTVTATAAFEANVSSAEISPEHSVKYGFSGSSSVTKNFSSPVTHLVIVNDGGSAISYSVNGTAFTVEPGEAHDRYFGSFTSVSITAGVAFRAYVQGAYQVPISELGSAPPVNPPDDQPGDTTAPADVQNLQATNVSANSLTLSWNASGSSDVASYEVYRGATLMATIAGTTYTVTGLSASTSYTFMVKAKDASGNVSAGSSVTQTTAAPSTDTTPPANVTGLQATNIASTGCTLSWQANTDSDIKDYRVYNGTTLFATVTATTYNVTGLAASTGYTFVVKSRDTSNNEASGSPVGVTTTAAPAVPATPSAPTATAKNASVDLTWPAVSGATSYKVYRGGTLVASPTTNSYTDTGLTNGTQYSYTVSAVNAAGESAQSAAATATPIQIGTTIVKSTNALSLANGAFVDVSSTSMNALCQSGAYTIAFSFRVPAVANAANLFSSNRHPILTTAAQKIDAWYNSSSPNLTSTTVIVANTWYHVAVTLAAGTNKMYVNGVLEATKSGLAASYGVTGVNIGGTPGITANRLTGNMKDIYVFNRALSADEVTGLFQETAVERNGLVAEYMMYNTADTAVLKDTGDGTHDGTFNTTAGSWSYVAD